ncbi:MAG TPA: DNA-3-methyladenine glycosylase I [Treponemataceae bacterium]|nr:DNA-3-methyladenine glycosylase I [Treponemataceae bacterium]
MEKKRCAWVNYQNPLYIRYHDEDWGVPVHEDRLLFEMLVLEGAQAGLSWETILNKREAYRKAFNNFDPFQVSKFNEDDVQRLLTNPGIIRNKLKIHSAIKNAQALLNIQAEFGSFDIYLWSYVEGIPIINSFFEHKDVPTSTPISESLSKDLKKRGMSFIGPTIIYAYMQSIGMVNDHTVDCYRHAELSK